MKWHPQTEQYRQECSDMTDVDKVVYLLDMFSIRQKEGQLAVLLHNAARMLEDKMTTEVIIESDVDEKVGEEYCYIGDWFYAPEMGYCILCQTAPKTFALIDIEDGNRVLEPIELDAVYIETPEYRYRLSFDDVRMLAGETFGPGLKKVKKVKISILS